MSKIKGIYLFVEERALLFFLNMAGRWVAIFNKGLQQESRSYFVNNYQVNEIKPERAEEIINEMISFRKSSILSFMPFVMGVFALLLSFLALVFSIFK